MSRPAEGTDRPCERCLELEAALAQTEERLRRLTETVDTRPAPGAGGAGYLTSRAEVEQELNAVETHLRLALESTRLGTWESEPGSDTLFCSERACEILGVTSGRTISRDWLLRQITPLDAEEIRDTIQYAQEAQMGTFSVEHRLLHFEPHTRWVRVTGRGIFRPGPDGQPRCERVIGTILDITDLKRAEEQMRDALDLARRVNEAKDSFIAKLSHELRTPLTPVLLSVSSMLERDGVDDELRGELEIIRRNVHLEANLIDDLLDVTRIASGKLELHMQPCDLHSLVAHALTICEEAARKRKAKIEYKLEASSHWVQGDATRLEQVLWNLLTNALKFSKQEGVIEIISFNPEPHRVRLSVRDYGMGIRADKIRRLFNAFEQGDRGVTREFGGLGLGLAICKGIIEQHDGKISAHSDGAERGAEFTIELTTVPARTGGTGSAVAKGWDEMRKQEAPPLRILLVEDHENTATVLQRLLTRASHQVTHVNCVADARHWGETTLFDLVISDLGLPDGSGLEVMMALRESQPGIRGIALSGFGTQADMLASRTCGFAFHLVKPVDWGILEAAIASLVSAPAAPADAP